MTAEQLRLRNIEFVSAAYNGKELVDAQMTRDDVRQANPDADDFHWNEAFGRIFIRAEDGTRIAYSTEIPGVGQVTRKLMTALRDRPGEFLTPHQIAAITGYRWFLNRANLAGRLARLRKAFRDDARKPRCFLSRRHSYAIAWHGDLTWRRSQAVALPIGGENGSTNAE